MARTGMLAGANQRAARDARPSEDIRRNPDGSEDKRAGRKGSLYQFYDDLGFVSTEENAASIRADEAKYQGVVADRKKEISTAQSSYDKAQSQWNKANSEWNNANNQYSNSYNQYNKSAAELAAAERQIPSLQQGVDKSWAQYKNSLIGVRVMGPGDRIEATYYVPPDVAHSFAGKRGVFASNHGRYTNVMIKNYRNQSLHDALRNGSSGLESKYRTAAARKIAPQIAQAYSNINKSKAAMASSKNQMDAYRSQLNASKNQLNSNKSQLNTNKNQITSANNSLNASVAKRAAEWAKLRKDYADRTATMKKVLGGITIES